MPKTPDYFAGKTIIITGAGSGIGRATALIFAREGANVVCADVNEAGARETAGMVNGKGSQALALEVDVTARPAVSAMVERTLAAFGSVQFLFNCAGAAIRRAKFLEIDDALMEKTFALNVNGTFYAMQAVLPHMLANKHGVIVNILGAAGERWTDAPAYGLSGTADADCPSGLLVARWPLPLRRRRGEWRRHRHVRRVDLAQFVIARQICNQNRARVPGTHTNSLKLNWLPLLVPWRSVCRSDRAL